jgi:RNA polymerase sigma-70 factor (ECF subfamily)
MDLVADDFLARLRTFVRRRVPSSSDADDVVQTVLLRLLEARETNDIDSPMSWVLATARTVIADLHRARGRSTMDLPEDASVSAPDDVQDITRCLAPLLRTLEAEDRACLERVDVGQESQVALAREYGISTTALKSRVQRARERLREAVLSRCRVERDALGAPTGPASCKPTDRGGDCGCTA